MIVELILIQDTKQLNILWLNKS